MFLLSFFFPESKQFLKFLFVFFLNILITTFLFLFLHQHLISLPLPSILWLLGADGVYIL